MPEFHGREVEHQEWKRKVLAREIELEEVDTTQHKERQGRHHRSVGCDPIGARTLQARSLAAERHFGKGDAVFCLYADGNSRLSCQISVTDALDQLRLKLPESQC